MFVQCRWPGVTLNGDSGVNNCDIFQKVTYYSLSIFEIKCAKTRLGKYLYVETYGAKLVVIISIHIFFSEIHSVSAINCKLLLVARNLRILATAVLNDRDYHESGLELGSLSPLNPTLVILSFPSSGLLMRPSSKS
jgi:hypothetical protein